MDNLNTATASNDRTFAILAHIGGIFTSWVIPLSMFLFFIPMLWAFIFSIIAAVKSSNGVSYRYPLTLRLFK